MQFFSFVPNDSYFNEAQALYIGLFDAPQSSDSGGLQYWEGQLASNQAGALNAISNYAMYNGQVLNSSNITGEIVNIYSNLLGETVSSSNGGVQYWASQWTGDGGSQSIGQITLDIYNAVESGNSPVTEVMNNKVMNYYNEVQSLYQELFNELPTLNAIQYWEGQLAANPTAALNALSGYVGLDGILSQGASALTTSNIATEINDIYENIFGLPVTSAGETYWASQWTGDGGTQSIAQIAADIYNIVVTLPATSSYNEALNTFISGADTSLSLSSTLSDVNDNYSAQSFTMPTSFQVPVENSGYVTSSNGNYVYYNSSYQYVHDFPASTTQSDTLILPVTSSSLSIADVNGNSYYGTMSYAFTGDDSGHNTVDVSYQASGGTGLTNYLADATNFQTLDFNYNGTGNGYNSLNLNLNLINSDFVNFVMDNSGFDKPFTFTNAVNADTFIVQATVSSLSVSDSTGNTDLNLIMNGNVSIGSDNSSALTFNGQTVNIDSAGIAGNSIGGIDFSNNTLITSMTLNITGSESLTIGAHPSSYSTYGIFLNDGSTLNVNDNSSAQLTIYVGDNSNSSNPTGITLNLSGSSAPVTIHDISPNNTPDTIILGSGTDNVFTDNGNSIITAGSGQDTITIDTSITDNYDNGVYTSYSGYMPDIKNAGPNDSMAFSGVSSAHPIQFESTQLNETSASSLNDAILNAMNDAYSLSSKASAGDFAVWFEYGTNTYIVNESGASYMWEGGFQIVQLAGTVNLSEATASVSTVHI
jgi:hypothetical protein